MITADQLLDQGELAGLLGIAESSLRAMRAQPERHRKLDGLPAPIRTVGNAPVWDRRSVMAWLEQRQPGRPSAGAAWAALRGCAETGEANESVDEVVYR